MLLGIEQQEHIDRFGRKSHHDILVMKCDVCAKEWKMRGSKTRVFSRKTHACSAECKSIAHKNGGVVERQRVATCVERFGVENPFASESCKQKMRETWKEKYDVEHGPASPRVRQRAMSTMRKRFGERPQSSEHIRKKHRETMQQNWGVSYPMQLPHVRDALLSGSISKYGVPYPMQNVEFQKQVFAQRDGISWMSKPEKQFRLMLEEKYGKENVKVQQLLERKWSVDFYVVPIDTWVSFDGVYWHGLDRPLEQIQSSQKPRDQAIYAKWLKDRELDSYMIEHDMKLVRITDQEFKADPQACLLRVERRVD